MTSITITPATGAAVRPVKRGNEVVGTVERGRDGFAFSCGLCGAQRHKRYAVDIRAAIETHLDLSHS